MSRTTTAIDHATAIAIMARIGAQLRQVLAVDHAHLPATLEQLLTEMRRREVIPERGGGQPANH